MPFLVLIVSNMVPMSFHGQWQVLNPATGEVIADVSCMGQKETNDAISSAYDAYNCKGLLN